MIKGATGQLGIGVEFHAMRTLWAKVAMFSALSGLVCGAADAQGVPQKAAAQKSAGATKKKATVDPDSPEGRKRRAVVELKRLAEQAPAVGQGVFISALKGASRCVGSLGLNSLLKKPLRVAR